MGFHIEQLSALADNYIYLVSDTELGLAMVVDPGDSDVVSKALKKRDLHLALILNTHHHTDHVAGNLKLQEEFGAPIIGPSLEANKIEGLSRGVEEGDIITFSDLRGQVISTPGHTAGSISYYFPSLKALFCGDTLFSLGCGRLFEGNATEMWESLKKLRDLPDETLMHCGHEYTQKNAVFAQAIDQRNKDLQERIGTIALRRQKGLATVPIDMGTEKKTNPFLRADDPEFQKMLGKAGFPVEGTDPAAIFGAIRAAKDRSA